jgi:Zn-dependent peptidase ImmA (M78 family)
MGGLFLPFTPNGKAIELRAIEVKERLGFGPTAAIDPFEVLAKVPARLVGCHDLWNRCPDTAQVLFVECSRDWSGIGFGFSPDDGAALILLNPAHAPTRQRATLLEELVHILLQHPTSRLVRGLDVNDWMRSHDSAVEDEAFAVGAACLIPYPAMFHAIRDDHKDAAQIAAHYDLSEQCVEFRIKRAGLSRVYQTRGGALRKGRQSGLGTR